MDDNTEKLAREVFSSRLIPCAKLILLILGNRKHEGFIVSDLAKLSGLSLPSVVMAKNTLLAEGRVKEHFPFRDGRQIKVYLTDSGREESNRLWAILDQYHELSAAWRGKDCRGD